jgi:hypothetical protein
MRGPLPFLTSGRCWRALGSTRSGNRSCRVDRQGDRYGSSLIVSQADDAAVSLGDRLHDRQA